MSTSKNPQSVNGYTLPATSWARTGLSSTDYVSVMRHSLPILARVGTAVSPQTMREIAAVAHVSPACELLRQPQRLYEEGLRFAMAQIWPPDDAPELDGLSGIIPADAVRIFVNAMYRRFQAHPDSLRLLISENLFNSADLAKRVGVMENSPVVLQLDRLLMRGYDVGAFREGVSAEDLYIVILSLCAFPVASGSTFHALYGMNVTDPANVDGLEKLIVDNVLAFLTSTMPTSQGNSYTHASPSPGMGPSVAARLYSREDLDFGELAVARGEGSDSLSDATSSPSADPDSAHTEDDLYGEE